MVEWVKSLPFFVVLMGCGAIAMIVPAAHALSVDDYLTMRVFFYGFILFGLFTLVVGLATHGYRPDSVARSQLLALLAAFSVLPLMFAVPFHEAVAGASMLDAWFEMVSSFTTTGATLYDTPEYVAPSVHLWRALVGWMGGLLMWITAVSIFAPMNIGGFEVRSSDRVGKGAVAASYSQFSQTKDPSRRLTRFAQKLSPIYAGLTFLLWIGLVSLGEAPYHALIHAMSTLATSGITGFTGFYQADAGVAGEVMVLLFFVFALSHLSFSPPLHDDKERGVLGDSEFRIAITLIALVTIVLFARHFVGAIESETGDSLRGVFQALWGGLFTTTSFLTTTGFESRLWLSAAGWSGLETPGLFLLGLALIGGGVATTAGGIKLLRIYALYRHSERELQRLVHPSSVAGGGLEARNIRRRGAYISWIVFMLFALSVSAVMLALSLTGVQFETAMVLAVAALSTTGPLAEVAAENPVAYSGITDSAKVILATAMVLGRLEALAIIALFNPEIWRN